MEWIGRILENNMQLIHGILFAVSMASTATHPVINSGPNALSCFSSLTMDCCGNFPRKPSFVQWIGYDASNYAAVQALLYTCLVILRRDAAMLASSAVLIPPDGASLWWQKEIQTGKGR